MKQLLFYLLIGSGISGFAQSDVLSFSYDSSGNQVIRQLICISCDDECPTCRKSVKDITAKDLLSDPDKEGLFYYPNPVKEMLYVTWDAKTSGHPSQLEVYTLSGQKIYGETLNGKEESVIDFKGLAEGIYEVLVLYDSGEQKSLKVIKK